MCVWHKIICCEFGVSTTDETRTYTHPPRSLAWSCIWLLFAIRHRFFNTEKFAIYYYFVFGTKILSCSDECSSISCRRILCQKKCEHSPLDEYAFARTTHTMQKEEKHSWFIYTIMDTAPATRVKMQTTQRPKSTNFTVAKFRGFGATNIKIVTRAFHHFPFFCLLLHYFSRARRSCSLSMFAQSRFSSV